MASSAEITIEANIRQGRGKGYARKLRKKGLIPANMLGKGKATAIEINPKLLSKAYQSEGRMFQLSLGGVSKKVKIHELQIDAVRRIALHVDLMDA